MRRIGVLVAAVLLCTGVVQATPQKDATTPKSSKSSKAKHHVAAFSGHNANKAALRTEPLEKPSGHISLRAENLGEEVDVNIYKPDGSFDEASLAKLDDMFRCVRTGEVRAVRRELYEQLSRINDHFEGKQIYLVSGFRFAERNSSRHYHASAMDIRIPGVSINEMYKYAESLDVGGMGLGIYPTSQFIHVDFRAPGEPSYRWTDYSGHGGGGGGHKKSRPTGHTQPARKPTS
jgi:uncharacterized protein YcbK (DUF882 family)